MQISLSLAGTIWQILTCLGVSGKVHHSTSISEIHSMAVLTRATLITLFWNEHTIASLRSFREIGPINKFVRDTFYGGSDKGYTDYPFLP